MRSRWTLVVGLVALIALVAIANVYLALYVGDVLCGGELNPQPEAGSGRASYCDVFEHSDDRVTLLIGLLFYAPVLILLCGGIVATVKRSGRTLRLTAVASLLWMAAVVLPAVLLPA